MRLCSIWFTANGLAEETTALYDIARADNDKTSLDLSAFVGMFTDEAMEAPQTTWAETDENWWCPPYHKATQRRENGALHACTTSIILKAFTAVISSASLCLFAALGECFCSYEDPYWGGRPQQQPWTNKNTRQPHEWAAFAFMV